MSLYVWSTQNLISFRCPNTMKYYFIIIKRPGLRLKYLIKCRAIILAFSFYSSRPSFFSPVCSFRSLSLHCSLRQHVTSRLHMASTCEGTRGRGSARQRDLKTSNRNAHSISSLLLCSIYFNYSNASVS